MNNATTYDVAIIGSGPAGCTCALTLKNAGLKVAMVDKQSFPRDKICGDAIPSRAIKTLASIHPDYIKYFQKIPNKCVTKHTKLFYKKNELKFDWVLDAYTCARYDFDNFLLSLVQSETDTDVRTQFDLSEIIADADHVTIATDDGDKIKTRLIIGADGAQSIVAKKLANRKVDRDHYIGSVRAYYSGLADTTVDTVEMYFDPHYLPSYFWIFPVAGGTANVGFGMLSAEIAKRNLDLKKTFHDFIERTPVLKEKFAPASQEGPLRGFGLPLGSKKTIVSGNRFMLTGDAASLIDPLLGDGIGNAMLSGKMAAEQATKCFRDGRFDAGYMKQYDRALYGELGGELKRNYLIQRALFKMPFLLDPLFIAGKNQQLKRIFQKWL